MAAAPVTSRQVKAHDFKRPAETLRVQEEPGGQGRPPDCYPPRGEDGMPPNFHFPIFHLPHRKLKNGIPLILLLPFFASLCHPAKNGTVSGPKIGF